MVAHVCARARNLQPHLPPGTGLREAVAVGRRDPLALGLVRLGRAARRAEGLRPRGGAVVRGARNSGARAAHARLRGAGRGGRPRQRPPLPPAPRTARVASSGSARRARGAARVARPGLARAPRGAGARHCCRMRRVLPAAARPRAAAR